MWKWRRRRRRRREGIFETQTILGEFWAREQERRGGKGEGEAKGFGAWFEFCPWDFLFFLGIVGGKPTRQPASQQPTASKEAGTRFVTEAGERWGERMGTRRALHESVDCMYIERPTSRSSKRALFF